MVQPRSQVTSARRKETTHVSGENNPAAEPRPRISIARTTSEPAVPRDRFPFYSMDALDEDEDLAEAVGAELRGLFESIDPAAGEGFWFDLTYDVGMGDWSTDRVPGLGHVLPLVAGS